MDSIKSKHEVNYRKTSMRKYCLSCLTGKTMFLMLETVENTWANSEASFRNKNVSEFVGKHLCFLKSKFCLRNNVSRGGQRAAT